jgi:adenosylcobinamide kinase/adenosylcobinamide-phosphate guanylyltransferase
LSRVILISGGARSGKSRLAEKLAGEWSPPLAYLATGQPGDVEMAERIARHRERRGDGWTTLEEPLAVVETLQNCDGLYGAILLDCVTLWLTNLLFSGNEEPGPVLAQVARLAHCCRTLQTPLIMVTNEVGLGIVPENRLARLFRDLAGEANELLAAAADEVYVTFAGLPLKLK